MRKAPQMPDHSLLCSEVILSTNGWDTTRSPKKRITVPQSAEELFSRAQALAGCTIGELATWLHSCFGSLPVRGKGKVGSLLEVALGAGAGNQAQPDFPHLGIELKTIPLDLLGRVRESTFVCTLNFQEIQQEEWETSRVWHKLRSVLWIPIESARHIPLARRHIGNPLLWCPNQEQERLLRADWNDLVGAVVIGGIETLTSHRGQVLQIRPKARDSKQRTVAFGPEGEHLHLVPRGFYLRARFTEAILWNQPVIP